MSATVSDFFQKVAVLARNGWSTCSGLGGRHGSELMAVLLRIMQIDHKKGIGLLFKHYLDKKSVITSCVVVL